MTFKRYSDKSQVDLIEYVRNRLSKNKNLTVSIGTDSQEIGNYYKYVTVVAFRDGLNGVSSIFSVKEEASIVKNSQSKNGKAKFVKKKRLRRRRGSRPRKKSREEILYRLRKETYLSLEVGFKLRSAFIDNIIIDLDYNKEDGGVTFGSNKARNVSNDVLQECAGMCVGSGFNYTAKPDEQVAIHISNKMCKTN